MLGKDGTGKCDAHFTGNSDDVMWGVLFNICETQKPILDTFESLGVGYNIKQIDVIGDQGNIEQAFMYQAIRIEPQAKPLCWYKQHVLFGANLLELPQHYIKSIESFETIKDHNQIRRIKELSIYSPSNVNK